MYIVFVQTEQQFLQLSGFHLVFWVGPCSHVDKLTEKFIEKGIKIYKDKHPL